MNKQRLTLLTTKAKRAATTGGVMDSTIVDPAAVAQRLADENRTFDTPAVLAALGRAVAEIRGVQATDPKLRADAYLEPAEIVEQAKQTMGVIDELLHRLEHAHPDLDCWASDALMRAFGQDLLMFRMRLQPDLCRLRSAFNLAGEKVSAYPKKAGPKRTPWMVQREALGKVLHEHSTPPLPVKAAPALAADLLELAGLPNPRGK